MPGASDLLLGASRARDTVRAMGSLWHPFSDMAVVERDGELVIDRGEGAYVWDADGNRYLDATAGLWFANIGHGRAELADAAAAQMRKVAAYSTFGDYVTAPTVELAERLAGIAPVPGSKVFLTSGGSDSIDTAAKLARRYWVEAGHPEKTVIIGRQKAYHGMHYAGTALGGIPGNVEGYGVLVPDTATVEWDSVDDLRATIERVGPERVAAFFCEPVVGAGGVYPPPPDYLAGVRKLCTELDVLFVADEVITGFGRIGGAWFASSKFGLEPDLVTCAKGLTSGYAPMGAVLVAPRVWEPFFGPEPGCGCGTGTPTRGTRPRRPSRSPTSTSSSGRACSTRRPGWRRRSLRGSHRWPISRGSWRFGAGRARWRRSSSPTRLRPWRWPSGCARSAWRRARSAPAVSRSRPRSS